MSSAQKSAPAFRIGNITVRGPLLVAAGPWSSGEQSMEPVSAAAAGAIVAKTITAEPRAGNPPPVLQPLSGPGRGFLNRVGLRNPGVTEYVRTQLPVTLRCGAPIIQSFTAHTQEEVEHILAALEPQPLVGYELNASCPNAASGQLDDEVLQTVLRRARRLTQRGIWVKLAYAPAELLRTRARICAEEGADAITAINTLPGLDVHFDAAAPRSFAIFRGGLSGPALTPLAQWAVDFLCREQPLPVIACGGVRSITEVLAFAALGAAAVQIGSVQLHRENSLPRLQRELGRALRRFGVTNFSALRSALGEVPCPRSTS